MQAPIIPIDPISNALNRVAWRLQLTETDQLESMVFQSPFERIMTFMRTATEAAKRDEGVRMLLASDGVLPGLKQMVIERKQEQDEAAAGESERQAAV